MGLGRRTDGGPTAHRAAGSAPAHACCIRWMDSEVRHGGSADPPARILPGSIAGSPCDGPTAGAILSEPIGAGTPAGGPGIPRSGTRERVSTGRRGHSRFARLPPAVALDPWSALPIHRPHTTTGRIERMDAKQVWRAALGELQVSLSPANYETWLRDTQLVDVEDNRFRISVPNGFAKDWLETRYRSLISQTLARIVGYSVQVEFVIGSTPEAPETPAEGFDADGPSAPRHPRPPPRRPPARASRSGSSRRGSAVRAARPTSIRATRSRTSSSARPTAWPTRPACRSPSVRDMPTTRCSCTAAWAWARPT